MHQDQIFLYYSIKHLMEPPAPTLCGCLHLSPSTFPFYMATFINNPTIDQPRRYFLYRLLELIKHPRSHCALDNKDVLEGNPLSVQWEVARIESSKVVSKSPSWIIGLTRRRFCALVKCAHVTTRAWRSQFGFASQRAGADNVIMHLGFITVTGRKMFGAFVILVDSVGYGFSYILSLLGWQLTTKTSPPS